MRLWINLDHVRSRSTDLIYIYIYILGEIVLFDTKRVGYILGFLFAISSFIL